MDSQQPTVHSLRYRQAAVQAWTNVLRPYLEQHRPDLLKCCCYVLGSSVAYGLADEYSDIDTVLVVSEAEIDARRKEWNDWACWSPEIRDFCSRHEVKLNVKVTCWRDSGAGTLFDADTNWQAYFGHHHFVSTLIFIHDPMAHEAAIRKAISRMPEGLSNAAAADLSGQLAGLAAEMTQVQGEPRFTGLFAYSIVGRALPLLFHRARQPVPFHKWQWPLAHRLGEDAKAVLYQLRRILERQEIGDAGFPHSLIPPGTPPAPWRVPPVNDPIPPIPADGPLPPKVLTQCLASVQWHLQERGSYQMVRSLARGWRHEALHYLCATRCLLIKGTVLLVTGCLPIGKALPKAWAGVRSAIGGLETCLYPDHGNDPVAAALEGIGLFRAELRRRNALPEEYLNRPLWSPPSHQLACVLEEP